MDQRKSAPPQRETKQERSIPVIPFVTLVLLLIGVVAWVDRSASHHTKAAYESPAPVARRNFTPEELELHPNDPPLIRAIRDSDIKTSLGLIDSGADVNQRNSEGGTPLYYSAGGLGDDLFPVTQALVAHGADVNARCGSIQVTPLHNADVDGSVKTVKFLISKGANVNARDGKGDTPLHAAAFTSYGSPLDIARILVEHGGDIDARNKAGLTVLDVYQRFRWQVTSAFLASKGAKKGS